MQNNIWVVIWMWFAQNFDFSVISDYPCARINREPSAARVWRDKQNNECFNSVFGPSLGLSSQILTSIDKKLSRLQIGRDNTQHQDHHNPSIGRKNCFISHKLPGCLFFWTTQRRNEMIIPLCDNQKKVRLEKATKNWWGRLFSLHSFVI